MAQTLWRYMTFEGFSSLILRESLWFTRIDMFPDKTEGLYPAKYYNAKFLKDQYNKTGPLDHKWKRGFGPEWQAEQAVIRHKIETLHRKRWAVNSWHSGTTEAEALWKTYANSGKGICIQSTFNRLTQCFNDDKYSVLVDKVKYIDRNRYFPSLRPHQKPFLLKPRSYFHEKEVRAYIDLLEGIKKPSLVEFNIEDADCSDNIEIPKNSELLNIIDKKGTYLKIDIKTLILRVILGPSCDHWIQELVENLLSSKSVSCDCVRSTLYDYPEFR
jgi:hypothetical protein